MDPFKIKKILIPLDFSFTSLKALDIAITLAEQARAEITLLHVIENLYATTDPLFAPSPKIVSYENEIKKISSRNLKKVADKIKHENIFKVNVISVTGRTHKEIIRVSKKLKSDIIIMGTHGVSGFREFVMGSNTFRVVNDSLCPVLSVQRKIKAMGFKNILVPFRDIPHSREKVMYAIRMAELNGSMVHVLGVDTDQTEAHIKKIDLEAQQIKRIVEKHNLKCKVKVIQGIYNAKTILSYAQKTGADLITITGDTGKQDITEYFTGSFAEQIINHSPIPVLSIHSKFNPASVELWHGV